MPFPLPDYTPDEIRERIEALRRTGWKGGLTNYSEMIGLSTNRLNHLFGHSRHPHLVFCREVATFAGISLEELVVIAQKRTFPKLVEQVMWSKQIKTVADLERRANVGRDAIAKRLIDQDRWASLYEYKEVADALQWSLDKLATIVLAPKVYTNVS